MWRERVYSVSVTPHVFWVFFHKILYFKGTLRPKSSTKTITGEYLDNLLGGLHIDNRRTDYNTTVSLAHDVNRITSGVYLGDKYTNKT